MQPSDLVSVYCEIAELVGVENAVKIYEHFRGQQMAFPTRIYSIQYVEKYVKDNYNGTNIKELMKKFNYSERRIRQFISERSETE